MARATRVVIRVSTALLIEVGLPRGKDAALEGLLWLFGVVVAVSFLTLLVALVCRRFHAASTAVYASFTLDQLRAMRDRGQISAQEYEVLLRRLVGDTSAVRKSPRRWVSDKRSAPR